MPVTEERVSSPFSVFGWNTSVASVGSSIVPAFSLGFHTNGSLPGLVFPFAALAAQVA